MVYVAHLLPRTRYTRFGCARTHPRFTPAFTPVTAHTFARLHTVTFGHTQFAGLVGLVTHTVTVTVTRLPDTTLFYGYALRTHADWLLPLLRLRLHTHTLIYGCHTAPVCPTLRLLRLIVTTFTRLRCVRVAVTHGCVYVAHTLLVRGIYARCLRYARFTPADTRFVLIYVRTFAVYATPLLIYRLVVQHRTVTQLTAALPVTTAHGFADYGLPHGRLDSLVVTHTVDHTHAYAFAPRVWTRGPPFTLRYTQLLHLLLPRILLRVPSFARLPLVALLHTDYVGLRLHCTPFVTLHGYVTHGLRAPLILPRITPTRCLRWLFTLRLFAATTGCVYCS